MAEQTTQAGGATPGSARGGRVRRILREPLLHFFVAGLLLFLAGQAWRDANDRRTITVTPQRVAALAQTYRLQFGAPPSPRQLEDAVDAWVREEAMVREGQAMGFDRDDEVVRRRIAQKVEFLYQDRSLPKPPDEAELRAWFDARAARYAAPVRTSFNHLYFSPDRPGDAGARAQAALTALIGGAPPDAVDADPYPEQSRYAALTATEARRLFGDTELAARIDGAPVRAWSGPYRSGYGWHLVYVTDRAPAGRAPFETVQAQVLQDYLADTQAQANAKAVARLVGRYRVVREDRP
ncbi:MAG: peptidyl-prolyl cis-trans isomerase [Phenylobacterium sp.]|uniref:peptidylprolyl isomerase n=1 Tax=Phenylobacterium sp. TaxID=1871053 RepID=UPI001A59E9BE|nr:peptidylprolyl isomerase [Phenylobacterium sp.]MBL8556809.1 peptidyl-prolyl cis-trans isomerase [Phenylobacterium sp.]